jgi:hypothetical protein
MADHMERPMRSTFAQPCRDHLLANPSIQLMLRDEALEA